MPLHLFIKRAARQLQLGQHRLDIASMPGQRSFQAMRLKRLLLRRQRLPGFDLFRFRLAKPQHLTFSDVGQFAYVTRPVMAEQAP